MEKFRAVMITDFNNPKSVAYKDVSMETWKKVSNVEVEPWQCYTPETMKESDHWPRMRWEPNLKSSAGKYSDVGHTITPTEQACLTSMYHWWEHILNTHERVIILEHDAFVRDPKKLESLVEQIPYTDLWSAGIAAECITFSPMFAKILFKKWIPNPPDMWIDAGPMAELWTGAYHFQEWKKKNPGYSESVMEQYRLRRHDSFLWCTGSESNMLAQGNDPRLIFKGKTGLQRAPVTQCYYPGVNTIKHHKKMGDLMNDYSAGSRRQMEILDKLDYGQD